MRGATYKISEISKYTGECIKIRWEVHEKYKNEYLNIQKQRELRK